MANFGPNTIAYYFHINGHSNNYIISFHSLSLVLDLVMIHINSFIKCLISFYFFFVFFTGPHILLFISFSILVPILLFPGTRPDSTTFRYSHRFDPFRYSAGQFFDTRTDFTVDPPFGCYFMQLILATCRSRISQYRIKIVELMDQLGEDTCKGE